MSLFIAMRAKAGPQRAGCWLASICDGGRRRPRLRRDVRVKPPRITKKHPLGSEAASERVTYRSPTFAKARLKQKNTLVSLLV